MTSWKEDKQDFVRECISVDQRMNGFVVMFWKDNNYVDPPSAPHGGLNTLADLRTLSIAPGVEDFCLWLTLGN